MASPNWATHCSCRQTKPLGQPLLPMSFASITPSRAIVLAISRTAAAVDAPQRAPVVRLGVFWSGKREPHVAVSPVRHRKRRPHVLPIAEEPELAVLGRQFLIRHRVVARNHAVRMPAESDGKMLALGRHGHDPQTGIVLFVPERDRPGVHAVAGHRRVEQLEPGDPAGAQQRAGPTLIRKIPAGKISILQRSARQILSRNLPRRCRPPEP